MESTSTIPNAAAAADATDRSSSSAASAAAARTPPPPFIWRYARRLEALARSKTSPDLARRVDDEDIVQSVFGSFFRGVAGLLRRPRRRGALEPLPGHHAEQDPAPTGPTTAPPR